MDGPHRRSLVLGLVRAAGTTAALLVLYSALPLDRDFSVGTLAALAAGVVVLGLLVGWQARAILRSQHPALRAVEATALTLPLFLLLFAAAYVVLSSTDPAAFTEPVDRTDGVYFVVTVFATVGFGDIAPVSQVARLLTTAQMIGDLVLIGLVLKVFLAAVDHARRQRAEHAP
ncbi:potassium channel family protein [Geodermatophilus sp. SYSU D00815]